MNWRNVIQQEREIDRFICYKRALEKNDIPFDPSLIYTCENVTFEEGLSKTIDWYLQNTEWLKHITNGEYQKYYDLQYNKKD